MMSVIVRRFGLQNRKIHARGNLVILQFGKLVI
jgi:hypothetical protein